MSAQFNEGGEKAKASASNANSNSSSVQTLVEKKQINDTAASKKRDLAYKLGGAIQYHMKDIYEEALAEGADVNYTDEEIAPALYVAIGSNNTWARKDLLQNRGANPRGVNKDNQRVPIQMAVAIGDIEAFEELVENYHIDPRTFREMNLLHSAIEAITSNALLQNAQFCTDANAVGKARNDVKLKNEIEQFFNQEGEYQPMVVDEDGNEESVPFKHKGPIHVFYAGQQDMIASLLSRGVNPTLAATGNDHRTPQLVAQNPNKFKYAFRGGEGTLKYLGEEHQNVLTFKMNFTNKIKQQGFEIIVHYDLKPVAKLIENYLPNVAVENIKNQEFSNARRISDEFRQLREDHAKVNEKVSNVERKHAEDAKQAADRNKVVDKKLGVKAEQRIEELCKRPGVERFFDLLSRKLYIKLDAYQQLSSGSIPRMKDTAGDYGTSIIEFVKGHTPPPFNVAFLPFEKYTKNKIDAKERKRYEEIASLLPSEKDTKVYCRELVCAITEGLIKFIDQLSPSTSDKMFTGDLDQLKEVEDLAKRAFVVAVHCVYNVHDLKIESKLSAEARTQALTQKILSAVANSSFFRELVESKIKIASAKVSPPRTPERPAVPPRPTVNFAFDMVRAAEDARRKEQEAPKKNALAAGLSKLKTKLVNAHMEQAYS